MPLYRVNALTMRGEHGAKTTPPLTFGTRHAHGLSSESQVSNLVKLAANFTSSVETRIPLIPE